MAMNFDANFWTVIVALASLIVSLYPNIRKILKGSKLTIEPLETISLSHRYGLTNAQWILTLTNSGGVDLRIKKLHIKLTRDGIPVELPARNFYRSPESSTAVMFTTIKLKPGDDISYNFGFYPVLNRNDERLLRELESNAKIETTPDLLSPTVKTLSFNTITQLTDFYNKNFHLKHGDYQIELFVTTDPQIKSLEYKFRFTIFEGDESDLRKLANGYISGHGVCIPPLGNIWLNIPLTNY